MPNVHLAPAEIRALLRLLTETSTREGALISATTKLGEALDAARTRRETRELEQHTATRLRNEAIEARNTELYEGWNDLEPTHCRNGHNKRLTRCQCDEPK